MRGAAVGIVHGEEARTDRGELRRGARLQLLRKDPVKEAHDPALAADEAGRGPARVRARGAQVRDARGIQAALELGREDEGGGLGAAVRGPLLHTLVRVRNQALGRHVDGTA